MTSIWENDRSGNVKFRIALKTDRERISEFNHKHFYPEEPITVGSKTGIPSEWEETYTLDSINFGTSFIAYTINVQGNEEIIGVVISMIAFPHDIDEMVQEANNCSNEQKNWRDMLNFWIWIDQQANIFKSMNIERSLHIHSLAVHSAYRGRGLGKELVKKQIALAKERDFPAVSIDCSSVYTIKIAESLGMKSYSWVPYTEIKGADGHQLFFPSEPHSFFGTFAIHIE